jgi:hypothetical protein
VFTGAGAINILGSEGILYGPVEWAFVCFGTGSVFALMYVLWSAAWRWITRHRQPILLASRIRTREINRFRLQCVVFGIASCDGEIRHLLR